MSVVPSRARLSSEHRHSLRGCVRLALLWAFVQTPVAIADPPASATYTYDDAGRLKTAVVSDGASVSYQYDAAGNRTNVTQTPAVSTGTIQLTAASATVVENVAGGLLTMVVSRSGGTSGAASVLCSAVNGSATAGADFTNPAATLTWANGVGGNQNCTIAITNDSTYEATETFSVTLTNVTGATLGSPASATVTINDDDPLPPAGTLQFTSSTLSVAENVPGGNAVLTVSRSGGSFGAASVLCSASSGTATAGVDFTNPAVTLNWADGNATSQSCSVPITNDSAFEVDETFSALLSGATGATLGSPNSASVTITNDDAAPVPGTLSFAPASYTVLENVGTLVVSVTRTGGTDIPVSVTAATGTTGTATSGSDYGAVSTTLNWGNNVNGAQTFAVTITDDTSPESAETFEVLLSGPTNGATLGTSTASITINDNEVGVLTFSPMTTTVGEAAGNATINVARVLGSYGAVSANYSTSNGTAVSGSDYTAVSGTLNWANGETTTKSFTIPITDDAVSETDETLVVALSGITGGAGYGLDGSVTITDNDSNLPSTPTNLASNDPPPVTDGSYTLSWTASTGPVAYYQLQEANDGGLFGSFNTYTINAPSVSRVFNSQPAGDWWYRVRACNASNQCSAFNANPLLVPVL